jgi:NAD(P) transhydrogenase subunit alpha
VLGVPRERAHAEKRVALVPDVVKRLVDEGSVVLVERGAGDGSSYPDEQYANAGAELVDDAHAIYDRADVVLKVHAPATYDDIDELAALRRGQVLIAFLSPMTHHDLVEHLRDTGVEAFSMDAIPRTTRAQSMDALSSQSNLAGYKSVVMAADALGKIFPLMMTAAGTITPARVLILGAGVAGLQAIGTARRLGAVVYGYDVRAVVREQVESLGAKFVELDLGEDLAGAGGYARQASADQTRLQQEGLAKEAALADVVITTALIPGRPAPVLITADAVRGMRPGSVIVDLAGETGGNCELSRYGETVVEHGVTIIAPENVPSLVPVHASQVLAKNIQSFLGLMIRGGRLNINFEDDIVAGTAIVHNGEVVHEATRKTMGLPEAGQPEAPPVAPEPVPPAAAEPPVGRVDLSPESVEDVAGDAPSEIEDAIDQSFGGDAGAWSEEMPTPPDVHTDPDEVFDDIDGTIDRNRPAGSDTRGDE